MIFKQKKTISLAALLVAAAASFNITKPTTLEDNPDFHYLEHYTNLDDRINHVFKLFLTDSSFRKSLSWFFERLIFAVKQNSEELKRSIMGKKGSEKDEFIELFIKELLRHKDCSEPAKGMSIGLALKQYLNLLPKESRELIGKLGLPELLRMIKFRINLNANKNAVY